MQTKRWNDSDNSNRYKWLVLSVLSAQSWVLPQIANLAWDCSALISHALSDTFLCSSSLERKINFLRTLFFPWLFTVHFCVSPLLVQAIQYCKLHSQCGKTKPNWENQTACSTDLILSPTLLLEVLGGVIFTVHGARKKWNFNLTLNFTLGAGYSAQNWSPTNIQGLNKCITKSTW